ncbi:hypothetical protein L208DRAFT_1363054 [Tricholoma matsutake]|nr:hypothetical protein L208DRAFT_1363054 [Tricholoma matsutake 945]
MSQSNASQVADIIRTNHVAFASFSVLIWDHIVTFADEVEYVWKGRKGFFVYMFFVNRYFNPLAFIVNFYAYLSPTWTTERCSHFVRYQGWTTAITVEVVALMMLIRINALYLEQKWIARGLGFLLLLETAVNIWLISGGEPVPHNPGSGIHACSLLFNPALYCIFFRIRFLGLIILYITRKNIASLWAWIPLVYDTIIFALTLYRTIPPIRRKEPNLIMRRMLEDGILYYSVMFSVTLVLAVMIMAAPPGIKTIAAQYVIFFWSETPGLNWSGASGRTEQLIPVAMMSRITISLRKAGRLADPMLTGRRLVPSGPGRMSYRSAPSVGSEYPLAFAHSMPPSVATDLPPDTQMIPP